MTAEQAAKSYFKNPLTYKLRCACGFTIEDVVGIAKILAKHHAEAGFDAGREEEWQRISPDGGETFENELVRICKEEYLLSIKL